MEDKKLQGVNALNQEFSKFEQVHKEQSYHLAENTAEDAFDDEYQIKTCDMRLFHEGGEAGKAAFAREVGLALEGIGFAVLTGHGVDPALYEQAQEKVRAIFEQIPLQDRMPYVARRIGSVNQGYFPMKETTIIHPDLVEGWVFCRRAFDMDGDPAFREDAFWPAPGFEPFFRQICQAHEALFLPIMQSILMYLGCEPHLYDEKLARTNFGFRLNYYPPINDQDEASGAGRMLGHEDVDLFTLLPAQSVDGLQVLNRENRKWIHLNPEPGSIILNTGDYMQRITNDRLPSTTHRVSKPLGRQLFDVPRITIPMAVYVWEDEVLDVLPCTDTPKYEPISAVKFHTAITSKYYGEDYAKDVS